MNLQYSLCLLRKSGRRYILDAAHCPRCCSVASISPLLTLFLQTHAHALVALYGLGAPIALSRALFVVFVSVSLLVCLQRRFVP